MGKISRNRIIYMFTSGLIELCRNIPTPIWLLFFYFVLPELLPEPVRKVLNESRLLNYFATIFGLSICNSAYVGEILRGGIESVPIEHVHAGLSLGLSRWQIWRYIIIPQTMRNVFPPLTSRMIHNLKNTSLAMAISVKEIVWATQQIESLTFKGIEATIIATAFFVIINLILSYTAQKIENVFFKDKIQATAKHRKHYG
jgi:polar amino acid transport system permease protein